MKLHDLSFKRKFSVNLYQSLKLPVGEMSMYKDWVNDKRGDPYTILAAEGDLCESVADAAYTVRSTEGGEISRLLGAFFPYYTYSFRIADMRCCDMGITVRDRDGGRQISVMLCEGSKVMIQTQDEVISWDCAVDIGDEVIITFRSGGVSIYLDSGLRPNLIGDASLAVLDDYLQ